MKAFIISDLHIQNKNDKSSQVLGDFFNVCLQNNPDRVYFLGDIFDYMIGEHPEYLEKYSFFFDGVKKIIENGSKVFYIEGNHDFHLEEVFQKMLKKYNLNAELFHYSGKAIKEEINDQVVWFGHGDILDYNNNAYKRWKRIYTSKYMYLLVSKILNFKMVEAIGSWASQDSRKRKTKKFDFQAAKSKYRIGAEKLAESGIHVIVAGHTHIEEDFRGKSTYGDYQYLNSGFPATSGKMIIFDGQFSLVSIQSFF